MNNHLKRSVVFAFLLVLTLCFVSAVPKTTQISLQSSLEIAYPQYDYVKQNVAFELRIHVINQTKYKTNITTVCFVDLYKPDGTALTHSFLKYDSADTDFVVNLSKGNFSSLGTHSFHINCNSTNEVGFANGVFQVTTTGEESTQVQVWGVLIMMVLSFFLVFVATLFGDKKWKMKSFFILSSFLFMIIAANSLKILLSDSTLLSVMGLSGLIITIAIASVSYLYIFIYYTKEVFSYFKKRKEGKWDSGPY